MIKNTNRSQFQSLKALVPLAAAALVGVKLLSAAKTEPQTGHWRSLTGFNAYKTAYDEAMASLPGPSRTMDVYTTFGSVRVYKWTADEQAPTNAAPVVLIPGIRSGVPMWAENLPHWIGNRTIYAMDAIGDAGLSSHAVPFDSFDQQAEWLEQVLTALELDRAHLVGHSFGGAIAATHALHHPGRVASLTLLEPIMVLHSLPMSTYAWSIPLLLPVPQVWKDRALAEIGGVSVKEIRERTAISVMIDTGSKHYKSIVLVPRTLSNAEWQSIGVPIRVEIAADKSLAGGMNAAERAHSLNFDRVVIRPNTTHSLPVQAASALGEELETYWTTHDR